MPKLNIPADTPSWHNANEIYAEQTEESVTCYLTQSDLVELSPALAPNSSLPPWKLAHARVTTLTESNQVIPVIEFRCIRRTNRDLLVSVASQPGTDEHGHEYRAGVKIHDQ